MLHVTAKPITRKRILCALLGAAGSVTAASSVSETVISGSDAAPVHKGVGRVNIRITMLPLTVTMRDFGPAGKVSGTLPKRLSEEGAASTDAGDVGDIAYYAPWGNIAFYRGRGPDASGVIKIARITSGIEMLNQPGQMRVTISRAD
ncbi:cyclophilin-like fold protein [Methylosarcina fibrata]|uniref:cyclophilin-like fold protein n=1 Tax=Methylosarcina fibrata TaxID=105972 RepID=UPI00037F5DCA|nr:cyclophilin-like fold protein [Methylosarcina fibrata]